MKKTFPLLIIFIVFTVAFLFISSCENNTPTTSPNQETVGRIDQQLDELEKQIDDLTNSINADTKDPENCGNLNFLHYFQSGTFTANASNGAPSTYTYSWQKYQFCNDRSPDKDDDTRSVPCGYWQSISSTSSTVYVSGFLPSFQLKCVVTDINGSATDYHTVSVSLP